RRRGDGGPRAPRLLGSGGGSGAALRWSGTAHLRGRVRQLRARPGRPPRGERAVPAPPRGAQRHRTVRRTWVGVCRLGGRAGRGRGVVRGAGIGRRRAARPGATLPALLLLVASLKKGARRGTPGDPARSATLDARAHGRVPPHHGPAVALAQHAQLRQLLLVQPIVALGEVQHRVVEPFLLVLGSGFQDAAAQDVRKQLVAGLFEGRGRGHLARLRTLLGHAWGAPLFSLDRERGDTGGGSGRSKPPINRRRNVIGRFATRKGRPRPPA